MLIFTIKSGSEANGYVIDAGGDVLMLECGAKPKSMLSAIGYETARISGCLISHEHS